MITQTKTASEVAASKAVSPVQSVSISSNHSSTLTLFQQKARAKLELIEVTKVKIPVFGANIGTDSEYKQRPNRPNQMITSQFALSENPDECIVLEHPSYGSNHLPVWSGDSVFGTLYGWEQISVCKPDVLFQPTVLMFFAPADILAGMFSESLARYIQQFCKQDARIRVDNGKKRASNLLALDLYYRTHNGDTCQVVLNVLDLAKLAVGGLKQTHESLGGKMPGKDAMDAYKTDMTVPYEDEALRPTYIDYARTDACVLHEMRANNLKRLDLLFGMHGLEVPREITTCGSMIATIFKAYLEKLVGEHNAATLFTITTKEDKQKEWELTDLLRRCTVEYFATSDGETTKPLNALVQGGAAKNFKPTVTSILDTVVADIDSGGFYVAIQRSMVYPVGLPRTYSTHESSKKYITLGKFLAQHGTELFNRCYQIVVNGSLSFHQIAVFSKIIESIQINDKYSEDNPNINSEFRLYSHQIKNGIFTSDVLDYFKKRCTPKEWVEIMTLRVKTAIWYPLSYRCETPEDWYKKTEAWVSEKGNSVEITTDKEGKETITDNRSPYWLAVPLEPFLKPYSDERNRLKDLMKSTNKAVELYDRLNARQNAMKLAGNTGYGVYASPYFEVGSVVVGNNITAAGRMCIIACLEALNGYQSITDGFCYDINKVSAIPNSFPSCNTASLMREPRLLNRHTASRIKTMRLGDPQTSWTLAQGKVDNGDKYQVLSNGVESYECKEEGWKHVDKLATDHITAYWAKVGGLKCLDVFVAAHKDMYAEATLYSQTSYQFKTSHDVADCLRGKIKARGHKIKGKVYYSNVECTGVTEESNILRLFDAIRNTPHAVPVFFAPQYITQVLKCNQANEMTTSKTANIYKTNGLMAGDTIVKRSWVRPLSMSPFCYQTHAQWVSWSKGNDDLKAKSGCGIEQYFINPDGVTFDYQRALVEIQAAIDAGKMWLHDFGGRGKQKTAIIVMHPNFEGACKVSIEDAPEYEDDTQYINPELEEDWEDPYAEFCLE